MINFNEFVECEIDSVSVVKGSQLNNIEICISDHNNQKWKLIAIDTSEFIMEEVRLQNIIQNIYLYDKNNITGLKNNAESESLRKKVFYLLRGRQPENNQDLTWGGVNNIVEGIKSSKQVFLEIEAVYGASTLLISKSISISKI